MKRYKWACPRCNCDDPCDFYCDCNVSAVFDGRELHGQTHGYPCPDAYCDRCGWSGTFPQPPVNPAEEKATMITLRNNDGSAFIEVAIPRSEAVLIAPALAPGWRFVEEVEIGTAPTMPAAPPEAKPEAPKPAKKPRAKVETKEPKVKQCSPIVVDAVRSRLSAGDGGPKSFAELAGGALKDSALRNALEAMRAAGEVVVTGQKRGTKYQLLPAMAQAAS